MGGEGDSFLLDFQAGVSQPRFGFVEPIAAAFAHGEEQAGVGGYFGRAGGDRSGSRDYGVEEAVEDHDSSSFG